jgi:hypothetical protein
MTTSADEGSSGVLRWWSRKDDGERCQKEFVESEDGRLAGFPGMEEIAAIVFIVMLMDGSSTSAVVNRRSLLASSK